MRQLELVRDTIVTDDDTLTAPDDIVIDDDTGRATFTLSHEQLLLLETFVAQPEWDLAATDAAAMFRRLGL